MRIKDLDSMINDDSDGGDDDVDGFGLQEMESAAVSTRQERNSILQVIQGWITRTTEMKTIPRVDKKDT